MQMTVQPATTNVQAQLSSRDNVKRCIEFRDPPRIGSRLQVNHIGGRV